ncbi:MAG: NAD(P)-dependent dehydrogenase (short-subunit alcohol dehydrogenase family) [Gammaproteobacteria bacterium]|jgi:NAD(P)-dependent dehydrogenase (short-subunit alcohol dehydrogenase family)
MSTEPSRNPPRNVLITGAASGIGKAVAGALLRDGHKVTIVDVNAESLTTAQHDLGPSDRVHFVEADITNDADCARAVAESVKRFGSLQALFNNAGIGMGVIRDDAEVNHPPIEELTPDIWERFFAINCLGPIRMTRAAIAELKTGGWGRIINNSTSYLTMLRVQPYGAVKSALESTSAVWAKELDGTGITVNVIVPGGPTDTPFVVEIGIPRQNMLRPAVMAPPIQWLMSDESNGFTGRRIVAGHWDTQLAPATAAAKVARTIGWPELTGDVIWLN